MSVLPIQFNAQLILVEAGVSIALPQISSPVNCAFAGTQYTQNIMQVPTTSGGTAIPLGSLGNLGLGLFINLDPTNYCEILVAVSGAAIVKLMPGDYALFRFGPAITAPAAIAHTAITSLQYLILEN
jgi:hypothetical protein